MTARVLRASISAGLVLCPVSMYAIGLTTFGYGGEWSARGVFVSVNSHPLLLGWDVLGVFAFYVLMRRKDSPQVVGFPGWIRRAVAIFVDLFFATTILQSISALILLELEALRTGRFVWSFERHYAVATDYSVGGSIELLNRALIFLYFAFPLMRGKQTVGSFVMRINIKPSSGTNHCTLWQAAKCIWHECRALASWPFTLLPGHDKEPRSATVLVEYP